MCEGSIHVRHRLATGKEKLVIKTIPDMSIKGYYPMDRDESHRLVCVRGTTTKAIIKQVKLLPGLARKIEAIWQGKRNVEVTLRHRSYQDTVLFPDGSVVHLMQFVDGTRFDIGYPVKAHVPAGMKLVEGAMREALALPPDPKPEGEDVPSTPAEPEREPVPAGDAPKARRRR